VDRGLGLTDGRFDASMSLGWNFGTRVSVGASGMMARSLGMTDAPAYRAFFTEGRCTVRWSASIQNEVGFRAVWQRYELATPQPGFDNTPEWVAFLSLTGTFGLGGTRPAPPGGDFP